MSASAAALAALPARPGPSPLAGYFDGDDAPAAAALGTVTLASALAARLDGGAAGLPGHLHLWAHPKRELLEAALHLAALATGDYWSAIGDGRAAARLRRELAILRRAGVIAPHRGKRRW